MYTNCESVLGKLDELKLRVDSLKPDLILLSETWLKNNTPEGLYSIQGYTVHSYINEAEVRGGVSIYVHNNLTATVMTNLMDVKCNDAIWLKLKVQKDVDIVLGALYRKGSRGKRQEDRILKCIEKVDTNSDVLICGDLNFPKINWQNGSTSESAESPSQKFIDKINDKFMFQKVQHPTRRRGQDEPSLLDLVLVSEEDAIDSVEHLPPLGASDHDVLVFEYNVTIEVPVLTKRYVFDFKNTDFDHLREQAGPQVWEDIWRTEDVEEQLSIFQQKYDEIVTSIPTKLVKPEDTKPMWWNNTVDRALKKKNCDWKRYQNSGRSRNQYKVYTKSRKKATKTLRQAKFEYERNLARNSKKNVKLFYKYANSKRKGKTPIVNMKVNGRLTKKEDDIRGEFSKFFKSVHTEETDLETLYLSDFMKAVMGEKPEERLDNINIEEEEVLEMLQSANPFKSLGPDGIHPRILKELAVQLYRPVTHIFRTSLRTGKVPRAWKTANVVPIYKKGSKLAVENYRPVSLTSCLGKILERIIRKRVTGLLEKTALVTQQHGFRPKRSCLTNLLSVMETWTKWLDEGDNFDVIYLDFQRAFDTVPHQRLVSKLFDLGIDGNLLHWFCSFLTDRLQGVKLNDKVSDLVEVRSGVPQGSVLGPICFIAYINDILNNMHTGEGSIFADDTKVYARVNSAEDGCLLQADLETLEDWGATEQMVYNVDKCTVVHYGKKNPLCEYKLRGEKLKNVSKQKDLGVVFTDDFKFKEHISGKVNEANQTLGIVNRTFSFKSIPSMKILYTSLVRPRLEFCVQAWSPYLRQDIEKIEKVQRRATRMIPQLKSCTYEERLARLELTTLEDRRIRGDAIQTFKMVYGFENIDAGHFFRPNTHAYRTRRHSRSLVVQRSRLEMRRNFFSQRATTVWNSLTEECVTANTVNSFKNKYDALMERRTVREQSQPYLWGK